MDPPTVKMGGKVTLTCNTTCSLSNNPTYIWYRNSQPVSDSHTSSSNTLIITSVSNKDTGYYSCAVRGHEDHPSPSVCVSNWSVTSTPKSICALKGSSVELHSYYTYPCNHKVTKAYWYITWVDGTKDPEDLKEDEHYQGRVTYTGNYKNTHTLSIRNLNVGDTKQYAFKFLTDQTGGKWTGQKVELSVTDLLVQMDPATVKEGGKVTLSCSTNCSLSNNPTYIWYKNSKHVENLHPADNSLVIDSARPEDAGKYSCAIKGHEALSSPEKYLNITYSPRNIYTSFSPSGDLHEGDSVTLTCSSDANPPAHSYTWYRKKGDKTVLQKLWRTATINFNLVSGSDGLYHCEAQNEVGSRNSTGVMISIPVSKIHFGWTSMVGGIIGGLMLGLVGGALAGVMVYKRVAQTRVVRDTSSRSQEPRPSPADDTYTGLNLTTRSPDYDTLDNVKVSADGVTYKHHPRLQTMRIMR